MKRVLAAAAVVVGLVGLVGMAGAVTVINNWCTSTYQLTGQGASPAGMDSAVVRALNPPIITVNKIVTNIRTNNTDPYSVAAVTGDVIQFKMIWANTGEGAADTIVLYDYVPAGMTIVAASNVDTKVNSAGSSLIAGTLVSYTGTAVGGTDTAAANGAFLFRATVN